MPENEGEVQFNCYSGCQKNVPVFKRFFLQPLMPQFRHSEHYYGKRYKCRTRLGGNVFWRVRFYHPFFSSRYPQMRDPNTSTLPDFPQKQ